VYVYYYKEFSAKFLAEFKVLWTEIESIIGRIQSILVSIIVRIR